MALATPDLAVVNHDATWLPPLLAATPKPALITQHFYIADAKDPSATIDTLISPAGVPYSPLASLEALASGAHVPFRMGETTPSTVEEKPA